MGPELFWCKANFEQQSELWDLCVSNKINVDYGMRPSAGYDAFTWWRRAGNVTSSTEFVMKKFFSRNNITFDDFRRRIIEAGQPKQPERVEQEPSQLVQIKNHLEAGKSITAIDALNLFGCFRLGARINDLRSAGLEIETEMITSGRKRFAKYSLKK